MKFSILVCPTTICIIIILLYNKFFYPICQTKLFFYSSAFALIIHLVQKIKNYMEDIVQN